MQSKCITSHTRVGLEGGEFLLHPESEKILQWFKNNHPNYDLLSNCLKPDNLIKMVTLYQPKRVYISLDGTKETYQYMRGKDGYDKVIKVIESLHKLVPISVMFTLSPYNDLEDLKHVAAICKKYTVDLRVGIYNNISFFDTVHDAHLNDVGTLKDEVNLSFGKLEEFKRGCIKPEISNYTGIDFSSVEKELENFDENIDFLKLYNFWKAKELKLNCYSIYDSLTILPNGDVPLCQNLSVVLGNIKDQPLDVIFNSVDSGKIQDHHCVNCNGCWVSFHRKYDIVLYRTLEKYLGRSVTKRMLGDYNWEAGKNTSYAKSLKNDYISYQ